MFTDMVLFCVQGDSEGPQNRGQRDTKDDTPNNKYFFSGPFLPAELCAHLTWRCCSSMQISGSKLLNMMTRVLLGGQQASTT